MFENIKEGGCREELGLERLFVCSIKRDQLGDLL